MIGVEKKRLVSEGASRFFVSFSTNWNYEIKTIDFLIFESMGQYSWKYVGDASPPKTVTLFHGDKTGHVLITMNSKIFLVDFKVRETKSYKFFIEEEFCEVKITKEGDRFVYTFEIDKNIQTPLNQARLATEKKHLWQTGAFFLAILIIIVVIAVLIDFMKKSGT